MRSNRLIKPGYLVPMFAIMLALMTITFLSAISFPCQVQAENKGNDGLSTKGFQVVNKAAGDHGWQTIESLSGYIKKAN